MIQRKQTLYLLLASLLALLTWLFPVATYETAAEHYKLMTYGLYTVDDVEVPDAGVRLPFSIMLTILGLALFAAIFMYRQRMRQMRFVRGTYLLTLGTIAFMFISHNSVGSYLGTSTNVEDRFGFSFILPLIVLVLTFMAERGIKADEKLVRSMDRLR